MKSFFKNLFNPPPKYCYLCGGVRGPYNQRLKNISIYYGSYCHWFLHYHDKCVANRLNDSDTFEVGDKTHKAILITDRVKRTSEDIEKARDYWEQ